MTADRFRLAYSTLGCPDWSFDYAAEQAAANGYSGLEVRILDGEIIPSDLSTARRMEIRQTLQRTGIEITMPQHAQILREWMAKLRD